MVKLSITPLHEHNYHTNAHIYSVVSLSFHQKTVCRVHWVEVFFKSLLLLRFTLGAPMQRTGRGCVVTMETQSWPHAVVFLLLSSILDTSCCIILNTSFLLKIKMQKLLRWMLSYRARVRVRVAVSWVMGCRHAVQCEVSPFSCGHAAWSHAVWADSLWAVRLCLPPAGTTSSLQCSSLKTEWILQITECHRFVPFCVILLYFHWQTNKFWNMNVFQMTRLEWTQTRPNICQVKSNIFQTLGKSEYI